MQNKFAAQPPDITQFCVLQVAFSTHTHAHPTHTAKETFKGFAMIKSTPLVNLTVESSVFYCCCCCCCLKFTILSARSWLRESMNQFLAHRR